MGKDHFAKRGARGDLPRLLLEKGAALNSGAPGLTGRPVGGKGPAGEAFILAPKYLDNTVPVMLNCFWKRQAVVCERAFFIRKQSQVGGGP